MGLSAESEGVAKQTTLHRQVPRRLRWRQSRLRLHAVVFQQQKKVHVFFSCHDNVECGYKTLWRCIRCFAPIVRNISDVAVRLMFPCRPRGTFCCGEASLGQLWPGWDKRPSWTLIWFAELVQRKLMKAIDIFTLHSYQSTQTIHLSVPNLTGYWSLRCSFILRVEVIRFSL